MPSLGFLGVTHGSPNVTVAKTDSGIMDETVRLGVKVSPPTVQSQVQVHRRPGKSSMPGLESGVTAVWRPELRYMPLLDGELGRRLEGW